MNWSLMLVVAAGLLIVSLGGCTPSMVLPHLRAFEGMIEGEVDTAIDEIEDRRCKLPIDILERTVNRRGSAWFEGWIASCPAAARLFRSAEESPVLSSGSATGGESVDP